MATDAEVLAAAGRISRIRAGIEKSQDIYDISFNKNDKQAVHYACWKVKRLMIDDERTLTDWAIAHLDAEAARERMRAEKVTKEWLDGIKERCRSTKLTVEITMGCDRVYAEIYDYNGKSAYWPMGCATKGAVLDLLAGLGIKATGGGE